MSTKAPVPTRLDFVDALRGLAVVFMIPLHTSHGWVEPALRRGNSWAAIQFFGGLAAPLFLTLSGVSLGLRWASAAQEDSRRRHVHDLSRALQIVVLGYAMRLQMWIVDGGGYARPEAYLAEVLLLVGYGLAYVSLEKLPRARRRAAVGFGVALPLIAIGLVRVSYVAPARLAGLLRVDVLQCIGGSLAIIVAIAAACSARGKDFTRPAFYVGCAVCVAFTTSWTRTWVPGVLPEGIAAYLGQWPPPPGRSVMGLFPLFPWLAYALIGTALGLVWSRALATKTLELRVVVLAALGACLALASSEALPHVFLAQPYVPWLTQPLRVAYRVGLFLVLALFALGITRVRSPLRAALDTLGRASLLVYWVHLQFAFGAASSPLSKRLGYLGWALGSLALVLAMVLVAHVRIAWPGRRGRATVLANRSAKVTEER